MYKDFEKIVLDFQLREHERFLHRFNQNYKRFDLNMDGVVNETEFRNMIISMGILKDESELEYLLT